MSKKDATKVWESRKSELLSSIDTAIETSSANKDVLEIMKELLESTKINTMEGYYEDYEDKEV